MNPFVWSHFWKGCAVGGCLVPLLGFFACGILLNDPGGPLLWPTLAPITVVLGAVGGIIVGAARDHPGRRCPDTDSGDRDEEGAE